MVPCLFHVSITISHSKKVVFKKLHETADKYSSYLYDTRRDDILILLLVLIVIREHP